MTTTELDKKSEEIVEMISVIHHGCSPLKLDTKRVLAQYIRTQIELVKLEPRESGDTIILRGGRRISEDQYDE